MKRCTFSAWKPTEPSMLRGRPHTISSAPCSSISRRISLLSGPQPTDWITVSAQRALIEGGVRREDRKKSVDKVAAAVILQAWLDNAQNVKEYNEMANDEIRRPDEEPETDEVPDVVELTDEDGNTTRFEYITTLDQDGELYIALMPIEDEENADDENGYVVFMKIEQDENGEDYYVSIDDDDLVDALFEKLTKMLDEEE